MWLNSILLLEQSQLLQTNSIQYANDTYHLSVDFVLSDLILILQTITSSIRSPVILHTSHFLYANLCTTGLYYLLTVNAKSFGLCFAQHSETCYHMQYGVGLQINTDQAVQQSLKNHIHSWFFFINIALKEIFYIINNSCTRNDVKASATQTNIYFSNIPRLTGSEEEWDHVIFGRRTSTTPQRRLDNFLMTFLCSYDHRLWNFIPHTTEQTFNTVARTSTAHTLFTLQQSDERCGPRSHSTNFFPQSDLWQW